MQVSQTYSNPYITQTTAISGVQKTNKTTETSSISQSTYTPPNQLSFEDYQSLSLNDVEALYPAPKDANGNINLTNSKESLDYEKATALWQVANTFEDNTLGKVLFSQVNKDNPSEADKLINNKISTASSLKWFELWARNDNDIGNYAPNKYGKHLNEFKAESSYTTQAEYRYAIEHNRISSKQFFEMVNLSLNDTKDWGDPNKVHFSDRSEER
ncbi:MAG: hypothetical protein RBT59_13520, partial [Arcobacteraceae bacterium]|nr:hypothetical protein [Arcobacteraceae bacterium]